MMQSCALAMGLLCLLCVSGCGDKAYYKRVDTPTTQQQRDLQECDFEAAKATGSLPDAAERDERIKALTDKCMRARGYEPD